MKDRQQDLGHGNEKPKGHKTFLKLRTTQELTPRELNKTELATRQLYTKSHLISEGRFGDLAQYDQTNDPRYEAEIGLTVEHHPQSQPDSNIPAGTEISFRSPRSPNHRVNKGVIGVFKSLWGNNPKT